MLSLFKKKQASLDAYGVELSASKHTNGTGGGAIIEINAWVYRF